MGSLDNGLAQLIETGGLGDFTYTEPTAATPPAITIGEQFEKPDAMITILVAAGEPPDRILGRKPQYQIVTRDLSYVVARDLAAAIHDLVHRHSGALDGEVVARTQADSEPVHLGRDGTGIGAGGRHEFTQTFTIYTHDGPP